MSDKFVTGAEDIAIDGGTIDSDHTHNVSTTDAPSGANITMDGAPSAGNTGAIARATHGHRLNSSSSNPVALGATAAPGTSGHSPSRDDHVHPYTGLALIGYAYYDSHF